MLTFSFCAAPPRGFFEQRRRQAAEVIAVLKEGVASGTPRATNHLPPVVAAFLDEATDAPEALPPLGLDAFTRTPQFFNRGWSVAVLA